MKQLTLFEKKVLLISAIAYPASVLLVAIINEHKSSYFFPTAPPTDGRMLLVFIFLFSLLPTTIMTALYMAGDVLTYRRKNIFSHQLLRDDIAGLLANQERTGYFLTSVGWERLYGQAIRLKPRLYSKIVSLLTTEIDELLKKKTSSSGAIGFGTDGFFILPERQKIPYQEINQLSVSRFFETLLWGRWKHTEQYKLGFHFQGKMFNYALRRVRPGDFPNLWFWRFDRLLNYLGFNRATEISSGSTMHYLRQTKESEMANNSPDRELIEQTGNLILGPHYSKYPIITLMIIIGVVIYIVISVIMY